MVFQFKPFLSKAIKFISSPIQTLINIIIYFIKSPWKLGGTIVLFSLLMKIYDSTIAFSFEPIIRYIGGMTLNTGNTISNNILILSVGEISWWGSFMCWLNILSAVYLFGLLFYGCYLVFTTSGGGTVPPLIVSCYALGLVLLLTNMYTLLFFESLAPYFGLKGFYDLFGYLIIHKDFVEGLINQTSYGGNMGNVSLNLSS